MIKPLEDRIVVEPFPAETETAGGIIIPDTVKEKPLKGTVRAIGAGIEGKPMVVAVGDVVLYGKYAGMEIHIDKKDYLIMRQSDLLAII